MKRDPHSPLPDPELRQLLGVWHVEPEPAADFTQRLHQRIAVEEARRAARPWLRLTAWAGWQPYRAAAALATLVLVIAAGALLYWNPGGSASATVAGVAAPTVQTAQVAQIDPLMRDLQAMDRDGELLEHLDFLSAPAAPAPAHLQDQD